MTRDDILRMARKAGLGFFVAKEAGAYVPECLERFAALVAAEATKIEREACAKECDALADKWRGTQDVVDFRLCAHNIRARGEP